MKTIKNRTMKNITVTVYNDQIDSLEQIRRTSIREMVPSRAELVREALDEYIKRNLQPDLPNWK